MVHGRATGRINPVVPAAVAAVGLVIAFAGWRSIGLGFSVGAVLAFINGILLSRRVDVAAGVGDIGRALLVMQLGLVTTCTVIGVATVVLVKISVPLAVSAAAGFAVAQLCGLAAFYWFQARGGDALGGEIT